MNIYKIDSYFENANKIVTGLENNIYPIKEETNLPKYVSLVIIREKSHLVFERYHKEKRLNLHP